MGPKKPRQRKSPGETQQGTIESIRNTGAESQTEETVSGIAEVKPNGAPAVPVTAPAVESPKESVVVRLDSNGGIDLAGMRDKTKEKLIAALKKSQEGLFPTGPAAPIKRFPEAAIRGAYGVVGMVEVGFASRKYPPELAQIFAYTEDDIKALMDPTQAVLARYAGTIKHEELIALGLVLTQIHVQKLYHVNRAMAQFEQRLAEQRAEAARKAAGPAPEDTTPKPPEGLQ